MRRISIGGKWIYYDENFEDSIALWAKRNQDKQYIKMENYKDGDTVVYNFQTKNETDTIVTKNIFDDKQDNVVQTLLYVKSFKFKGQKFKGRKEMGENNIANLEIEQNYLSDGSVETDINENGKLRAWFEYNGELLLKSVVRKNVIYRPNGKDNRLSSDGIIDTEYDSVTGSTKRVEYVVSGKDDNVLHKYLYRGGRVFTLKENEVKAIQRLDELKKKGENITFAEHEELESLNKYFFRVNGAFSNSKTVDENGTITEKVFKNPYGSFKAEGLEYKYDKAVTFYKMKREQNDIVEKVDINGKIIIEVRNGVIIKGKNYFQNIIPENNLEYSSKDIHNEVPTREPSTDKPSSSEVVPEKNQPMVEGVKSASKDALEENGSMVQDENFAREAGLGKGKEPAKDGTPITENKILKYEETESILSTGKPSTGGLSSSEVVPEKNQPIVEGVKSACEDVPEENDSKGQEESSARAAGSGKGKEPAKDETTITKRNGPKEDKNSKGMLNKIQELFYKKSDSKKLLDNSYKEKTLPKQQRMSYAEVAKKGLNKKKKIT